MRILALAVVGLGGGLAACGSGSDSGSNSNSNDEEQAALSIEEPPPGTMILGAAPVPVRLSISEGEVVINGEQPMSLDESSVWLPPVDGLGVVSAAAVDDTHGALRAYHQGYFHPADVHWEDAVGLTFGLEALDSADNHTSMATLAATLLLSEDFTQQLEGSYRVGHQNAVFAGAVVFSGLRCNYAVVRLVPSEEGFLDFQATLRAAVDFTIDGWSMYVGTASWANNTTFVDSTMQIRGRVTFDGAGVSFTHVTTYAPPPLVQDTYDALSNELKAELIEILDPQVPVIMEQATVQALRSIFDGVLGAVVPRADSSAFLQPVDQDTHCGDASFTESAVSLSYATRLTPRWSRLAQPENAVLRRDTSSATAMTNHLGLRLGAPYINQLAYAAWDAGNFEDIYFTADELQALDAPALDTPGEPLEGVITRLALPPLLEWRSDGPWLDVGGLEATLLLPAPTSPTLRAAARVPVLLEDQGDGELRLVPDPSRDVTVLGVGYEGDAAWVDPDQATQLMAVLAPGLLSTVLGSVPVVQLPPISIPLLNQSPGPQLTPQLVDLVTGTDAWLLSVELVANPQ